MYSHNIHRSISQPSFDLNTQRGNQTTSIATLGQLITKKQRGQFLWEGKFQKYTKAFVMMAWNAWFQRLVLLTIIYKFLVHFLLAYCMDHNWYLDLSIRACEIVFIIDVLVHVLHAYWPLMRKYVSIYRRNLFFLTYDILSLVPLIGIYQGKLEETLTLTGRWIEIGRIYRLFHFFQDVKDQVRKTRKLLFFVEQMVTTTLALHASTCIWYYLNQKDPLEKPWHDLGYPPHVNIKALNFDNYRSCLYYCACRFFNVIFGDAIPVSCCQKWLISSLMLLGFAYFRYRFIGSLAWELVIQHSRRHSYMEKYHHMINYLKFNGAPKWLIEQCSNYKLKLWQMKDGILRSEQLHKLPLQLQMELTFDINVDGLHSSLLFKDTHESSMRQVSLLIHHELFLAGQIIWSQGVVKNGMIYIKRGVIEMLSDEDDESPMIAFKAGTVLGELSLLYSIPSKVTVKAATYVEIQVCMAQVLRRTDFMRAIAEYPTTYEFIRNKIQKRIKDSKSRQEAIERYDKGDSRLIRTRYRPMKVLKDNLAGVEKEDPTFIDDSHMYYRDENNVRYPKFTTEYLELYQMSPNVTTIEEPRICSRSSLPWILIPDTDLTNMFDIVHFIMVLYVCIISPYSALQSKQSQAGDIEKIITSIVLAGLLFNIYIQLTTAIIKKNIRKETIKDIAEVKMATVGFYFDVISVLPLYVFTDTLDPYNETVAGQIVRLTPILQVWHIWHYLDNWTEKCQWAPKFQSLIKYCLLFVILSYWSGCFLYILACPRKLCSMGSWMSQLIFWETKVFTSNDAKHENPLKTALGFGTAVFTGAGTTDIAPGGNELIIVMMLFVLGAYLSCFYSASICSNYLLSTQRKLKFRESIRELFYFLSINRVSGKIKARVEKFFCVQWYYNNAVSTEEIFGDISTNLQQEVRAVEMVETLKSCPLLQVSNHDFLQTVANNMRKIVLPDNEVVQHGADIGRDMYIVKSGHCDVLDHTGKKLRTIGPGSSFGVLEMLFGLPKVYTVMTSTNCILLHVEYSALMQCWGTFPEVNHPIATVLKDPELCMRASAHEEAKPLTGRFYVKRNRITKEIKESFVILSTPEKRVQYMEAFDKLGIFRYLRYIFVPGCITPHGIFLKLWCALQFMLAVYYIIVVPYDIATKQHRFGGRYNWIDILSYVDIIMMSYVAYYDEKNLLITHPLLCASRYLKHTFPWDLLSVFPFEQLVRVVNENTNLDVYRINRMLCVTRIAGVFSFCESKILNVDSFLILIKFPTIAVTIVNTATAFIFASACVPYLPVQSSFIHVNCSSVMILNNNSHTSTYAYKEYAYTFYWVYEIFAGLGCHPVSMWNKVDMWHIMCLQITGLLYFAFMFGYIASKRSASASALLDHNEKTKDLENFLYQENVDAVLIAKTLKYFEYVWKRTNGSDPQKICRRLNSALMEDTLVFMYERALREVPLFGKVEKSFIRVITQHLHEMYFLRGDTVIQCKDIESCIYIIYRGKVDVLTSYNEMITCMGPGGMFGNFTGLPISCSEVTICASRNLDLLVIPSVSFFSLIKYYPKIQEPLNKAFETSKSYILPITMEIADDSSSDEGSAVDLISMESGITFKSGSSKYDTLGQAINASQSSLSQAKSSASINTFQSYSNAPSILRPGTPLFQNIADVHDSQYQPLNLLSEHELFATARTFRKRWTKAAQERNEYLKLTKTSIKPAFKPLSIIELLKGFQGCGYFTCFMVTAQYVLGLYDVVTLNDCIVLYWIHAVFDVYFYINVYLCMHQGYFSKHGDLVLDGPKCRHRYFHHKLWVWSDLLANFPLELIGLFFPNDTNFIHYLRINKLFRIKYLYQFYRLTSKNLTNNLTTLQAVMTVIIVIFMIHTFTCLWLVSMIGTSPVSYIRTLKIYQIDADTPHQRWDYVTSFYIVVSQLTATGSDEFVIDHILPMSILGVILVCGKVLAATVVASSIQLAYANKYALNAYEKVTKELFDMLKSQGLSSYQLKKFRKYIQQLWITRRGQQLPELLSQTPYVRRCDLMSAMFGHHLRNCYIFTDTGEAFLRQLTVVLDYTTFFPGNYILVAGDSDARMYWVAVGTVSVVSVRADFTEILHETLGPGDVFGVLQAMHKGIAHSFSYKAESKVTVLSLSLDSWINILPFFPEARRIIQERSEILFTHI